MSYELLVMAKRILAKLDHPTASVTSFDADKLRAAIEAVEAESHIARIPELGQSHRAEVEAAAMSCVLVHAPLHALQHGIIASYEETLELMVLSLVKHNGELMRKLVSAELARRPETIKPGNAGA